MLLVVLWLLIFTRSRLLVVGLLSIVEALCPSQCLFRTILVTPCLMVWDWRVSRAEPMLSCWHDLLFLICLQLFYLLLPSMGWLCGVGVFGLIERSHSLPVLHRGLQIIIILGGMTNVDDHLAVYLHYENERRGFSLFYYYSDINIVGYHSLSIWSHRKPKSSAWWKSAIYPVETSLELLTSLIIAKPWPSNY